MSVSDLRSFLSTANQKEGEILHRFGFILWLQSNEQLNASASIFIALLSGNDKKRTLSHHNSICFYGIFLPPHLSPATWLCIEATLLLHIHRDTHTHTHAHFFGNLYNLKSFFLFLFFSCLFLFSRFHNLLHREYDNSKVRISNWRQSSFLKYAIMADVVLSIALINTISVKVYFSLCNI